MDNAVTVLPEPDSPTNASVSPLSSANDTPFTAASARSGNAKLTPRFLISSKAIGRQLSAISLSPRDESCQHSLDLLNLHKHTIPRRRRQQFEIVRQQDEIFEFARRAHRNVQEAREIGVALTSASFRDIGRYRGRRAPHLAGDTIPFGRRKAFCRAVDRQDNGV